VVEANKNLPARRNKMEYQENRDAFARAELANTNQVLGMLLRALEECDEATTNTFVDLAERTLIKNQKFLNSYKD
jgi:hypothetical protein